MAKSILPFNFSLSKDKFNYFLSGLLISFLYALSLILVVFSFCTYHFLKEIENSDIGVQSERARNTFIFHQCDVSVLMKAFQGNTEFKFESSIMEIPCIQIKESIRVHKNTAYDILSEHSDALDEYNKRIESKQSDVLGFEDQLKNLASSSSDIHFIQGNLERANNDIAKYKELIAEYNSDDVIYKNITKENEFYAKFFKLVFLGVIDFKNAWQIPEVLLSIILVMSMGALGSLVKITVDYLSIERERHDQIVVFNYLFRLMLGTIIALVVFISIKAGHLSMSEDPNSGISPYVLSFIGIMSGLISEKIYVRLVEYGHKTIGHQNDRRK